MDIKDFVKTVTVQTINMVGIVIEIATDNLCRKEGWNYIDNFDCDSVIEDVGYSENMKFIGNFIYKEYNTDAVVSFNFVNVNNKDLVEFKDMVDCIGKYVYDIRKGKKYINTTSEVNQWLKDNLEELIVKYR